MSPLHDREGTELPSISPFVTAWFRRYARRYFAKHFYSVKLARDGRDLSKLDGPILLVLNHPAWWDPLFGVVLSERLDGRSHYAVIDAAALERFKFFRKLGFFGIDMAAPRGAATFLRLGAAILRQPRSVLWVTAQGTFRDPRDRPAALMPGVAHLTRQLTHVTILPLAIEYPFWTERQPVALARFGEPLVVNDGSGLKASEWLTRIETALTLTQDRLALDARSRDESAFETLIHGRGAGVGGPYDWWRRWRAARAGERFDPSHAAVMSTTARRSRNSQDTST